MCVMCVCAHTLRLFISQQCFSRMVNSFLTMIDSILLKSNHITSFVRTIIPGTNVGIIDLHGVVILEPSLLGRFFPISKFLAIPPIEIYLY